MDVAVRPARISEVLLADEHERRVGHPSRVRVSFSPAAISRQTAADVDRPGAPSRLVRPRNPALDGEVDLERPRAVAVPRQRPSDPARHPLASDPRRRRGCEVEHDDVGAVAARRASAPARRSQTVRPRSSSREIIAPLIAAEPPSATGQP